HPHLHIVTTNIRNDGSRISLHNLGRNQSEKARKEIELTFGLVKAEGQKSAEEMSQIRVSAQKLTYGKTATKRAIANALIVVLNQYKFTSLPELNAILQLYNIMADRGEKDSKM